MSNTIPFGSTSTASTLPFGGGSQTPTSQVPTPKSNPIWDSIAGYGKNIASQVQQGGEAVNSAFTDPTKNPLQQGFDSSVAAAASVPKVAASFLPGGTTALNTAGQLFSNTINAAGTITADTGGLLADIPAYQKLVASYPKVTDAILQGGENTAKVGEGAGTIASTILGAQGVASGLESTVGAVKDAIPTVRGINAAANDLTPPEAAPTFNEGKVTDLYNRAIRPSVAGRANAGQIAGANSKVLTGLQAIADNKANLSFTNADGETLTNATPKSVDELSSSIAQTKSSIFKKYDAIAQQAGETGITVDGNNIARELDSVINSKSLNLTNPKAVQYAEDVQSRYSKIGEIDAQTAQDAIQHYNDSLKAFYRNPNYDTASQASIDAMVANKLRTQLDDGISSRADGEQYQDLKNQYGSLSSMEKDVARRATVWGRQNKVGLADNIANIASGAELIRGLATLNPADFLVSGTIKGIQMYHEYLNNPDVGVSKIFSEIGKSRPK